MDSRIRNMGAKAAALMLALLVALSLAACAGSSGKAAERSGEVATASADATTAPAVTSPGAVTSQGATTPPGVADGSATGPAVSDAADGSADAGGDGKDGDASGREKKGSATKPGGSGSSDKADKKKNDKSKGGDKPAPVKAPEPAPANDKLTVAISIDCLTLYAEDPEMAGQVSSKGVVKGKGNVTVGKDASAYDVLKASGVTFSGKEYILSIGGLSEFDGGPESGWTYLVNGAYASVGVTKYKVKSGDFVQFRYTLNGGADVK